MGRNLHIPLRRLLDRLEVGEEAWVKQLINGILPIWEVAEPRVFPAGRTLLLSLIAKLFLRENSGRRLDENSEALKIAHFERGPITKLRMVGRMPRALSLQKRPRGRPESYSGSKQSEILQAVGDPKLSETNRAAAIYSLVNILSRIHVAQVGRMFRKAAFHNRLGVAKAPSDAEEA